MREGREEWREGGKVRYSYSLPNHTVCSGVRVCVRVRPLSKRMYGVCLP